MYVNKYYHSENRYFRRCSNTELEDGRRNVKSLNLKMSDVKTGSPQKEASNSALIEAIIQTGRLQLGSSLGSGICVVEMEFWLVALSCLWVLKEHNQLPISDCIQ